MSMYGNFSQALYLRKSFGPDIFKSLFIAFLWQKIYNCTRNWIRCCQNVFKRSSNLFNTHYNRFPANCFCCSKSFTPIYGLTAKKSDKHC